MERKSTLLLKVAIYFVGIMILLLCIFLLPWLNHYVAALNPEFAYLQYPVLIGIYVTAIPFFIASYFALKLLNYIENNQAFSSLSVKALKYIKNCANLISLFYIIGAIFLLSQNALHPSIAIIGLTIIFTSLIIALFTTVLQKLFSNALQIKTENDLTV